jgi:hypothetical protein
VPARLEGDRHVGHALVHADVEDGDDVRVVQLGRDPRLAQEALGGDRVGGERGREYLERDFAPERLLLRQVHGRHAAMAEQAKTV